MFTVSVQGLTSVLVYTIFSSALGMFQFGFNSGVINAPESNIEQFIKDVYRSRNSTDIEEGNVKLIFFIIVSIFALGGMLGGFSGGTIANRFGRKKGILFNCLIDIIGACLMGFSKSFNSYEMLFIGRFVIGISCGLHTVLVPMYISEISPKNLRGGIGVVNQLGVGLGLTVSEILGIDQLLGTDNNWNILLGLSICSPILQLICLPFCCESPRYLLITRWKENDAREALKKLRASDEVEEDIDEMKAEQRAQQSESSFSIMDLITSKTLRLPLLIGIIVQLSQQLSGINGVLYYSTSIFTSTGLSIQIAKFLTIGTGVILVVMALVIMPLIDRAGRRTLLLSGVGGMFIFSVCITVSFVMKSFLSWMAYFSVVAIFGFVVCFALGPGSIAWMITAELFSQGPRPTAISIAVLVNWFANFLVGVGFPTMAAYLGNFTFVPFSVLLASFWIFIFYKLPETKNKTFEEICNFFKHI